MEEITHEEQEKMEEDILDAEVEDILDKEVKDILSKNPDEKRGGSRTGAGRKKGSTQSQQANLKKKVREYMSEKDTRMLVERIKKWSKMDKRMAMWLADQVFGKARQNMGLDGGADDKPITMAALLDSLEEPKKAVKGPDDIYRID